jgi:hypothetical protein
MIICIRCGGGGGGGRGWKIYALSRGGATQDYDFIYIQATSFTSSRTPKPPEIQRIRTTPCPPPPLPLPPAIRGLTAHAKTHRPAHITNHQTRPCLEAPGRTAPPAPCGYPPPRHSLPRSLPVAAAAVLRPGQWVGGRAQLYAAHCAIPTCTSTPAPAHQRHYCPPAPARAARGRPAPVRRARLIVRVRVSR